MRSKSRHTLRLRNPLLHLCATISSSTGLLLLNSSTDPKLVFLDNGKFSVEINLAEPVEPFCKNRPNIYFGWRSRSQLNGSGSTGRRKSDQIAKVSIQCYKNSVGFDGKPSYLPICFPAKPAARASRTSTASVAAAHCADRMLKFSSNNRRTQDSASTISSAAARAAYSHTAIRSALLN